MKNISSFEIHKNSFGMLNRLSFPKVSSEAMVEKRV